MGPTNMALWARDATSEVKAAPSTFTNWDKCMAKSYCNCCCPSGRRRNKAPKYYDDPTYHHPPPPKPTYQQPPTPTPPVYRGAVQTATFDNASKSATSKVDEDSLPAMPTWAGATDKRVEDPNHHEDVEMEPLNPQDRKQGAGTPLHPGSAYSEYPSDRTSPAAGAVGYRGFGPTDPYARRSPVPTTGFAAAQDPYGRRSPGPALASPAPAVDPYGRRSPGPAAAMDPYGRRSPGPAAAMDPYGRRSPGPAVAMDPYGRRSPGPAAIYTGAPDPYAPPRSPGLASPVGAPSPYDNQPYHQQSYDDYGHNNANQYHAVSSPSPVAAYNPANTYSPVPMALSPSSEPRHTPAPVAGFQRQPSFGSSQYPPSYTTQPPYRGVSPAIPSSPPPAFQAYTPAENTHEYGGTAHEYGTAISTADPSRDRPPSLLQSGRKPGPNTTPHF
ncbi:hypothetical protein N7492_003041 [Penicillium capsulatum]|uniref:Uncharacterized protein n=1 Tax=Penicillium capsulatum TaxID=69766 RepID=A0A9W9LVQ8_9EURO|nr:hypothetical protein N7492_003041 [Penicillium capsulatum]KAJ6122368.1 hypothetical protein N7512_004833 [Penicillium capsulatum]